MRKRQGRPDRLRTAPTGRALSRQSVAAACPCGCLSKPPHYDDPDCIRHRPIQQQCNVCLSFGYGERERLETCRHDRRCPLARNIIGGGRR